MDYMCLRVLTSYNKGVGSITRKASMATIKTPEDVVTVDVHAAKDLFSSGNRYLDVRTIEEYNNGHVDNALNVPYMFITQEGRVKNPEFIAQVSAICKKEEHLIVGCNIGGRAMKACVDLLNDGYQQVTRMGGGYKAWAESLVIKSDKLPEDN